MSEALRMTERRPLSVQVADTLMERILEQDLIPGDRLPTEPELAAEFGVSRTVVREAGRTLVARGVVTIRPRRGMEVAQFDQGLLSRQVGLMLRLGGGTFTQLQEMREALEPGIASWAAVRRSQGDVLELDELVRRVDPTTTNLGRQESIAADVEFHAAIARAAANPFFEQLVHPINEILSATYITSPGYTPERAKTHAEHARIADAIRSGDAELARLEMHEHIARIGAAVETLVSTPHRGEA